MLALQEWLALAAVIAVVVVALRRRWLRRRSASCKDCGVAAGCAPGAAKDDDVRTLDAREQISRLKRNPPGQD